MAGGPSTPAFVIAVAAAGSMGFLAAGYQSPESLTAHIAAVRASGAPFGVNVFAPNPVDIELACFRRYAAQIQPDAQRYGLDLSEATPRADDDDWAAKIDVLTRDPVPVVSFTFGLPDARVVDALRRAGSRVVLTVTSAAEADAAASLGPAALVVQCAAAGGHSGTWTPGNPPEPLPLPELLAAVRGRTTVPLLAAGGIGSSVDVAAALRAGASAVLVGTALARTDESGATATYKAALGDQGRGDTVVTRAFTGRPARAVRNEFTDRHTATAPLGYPALHYLTSPLRAAAHAAGDPERVNLWAGAGYRHARTGPVADMVKKLTRDL
jgi:NAD(P)H-dependent flavin oxidoreductase YrpB (nitropropane dioxygenase family)